MADEIDFGRTEMPVAETKTGTIENKQLLADAPMPKQAIDKPVEEPKEDIITELPAQTDFAMPVAIQENDAARQIIITEQGSGSASVKTYYLVFENGKWILQPEWVITAKEIILDSISTKIDSSIKRARKNYPAQQ
jgi:hypothetical protein